MAVDEQDRADIINDALDDLKEEIDGIISNRRKLFIDSLGDILTDNLDTAKTRLSKELERVINNIQRESVSNLRNYISESFVDSGPGEGLSDLFLSLLDSKFKSSRGKKSSSQFYSDYLSSLISGKRDL